MASQKITAGIRDALVEAAKERKFKEARGILERHEDQLKKMKATVGELCYKALFTPHEMRLIKGLPKGWLNENSCARVSITGEGIVEFKFNSNKPLPARYNGYGTVGVTLESDHPVMERRRELVKFKEQVAFSREELRNSESALAIKVRGVIESVTTTGRLKEIWPEVVELLPMASQPVGSMLPMINLADLNKELGIG